LRRRRRRNLLLRRRRRGKEARGSAHGASPGRAGTPGGYGRSHCGFLLRIGNMV